MVLLVESLRRYGGAYADCQVHAVSHRPSRRMGAACRANLGDRVTIKDAILVHYHWLLGKEHVVESTVLGEGADLPADH